MGNNCYVVEDYGTPPIVVHSYADARMCARAIVDNSVRKGAFADAEGYDHAVDALIRSAVEIHGLVGSDDR